MLNKNAKKKARTNSKIAAAGFSLVLALSLLLTACGDTSQTPEPESQPQGSSAQAITEVPESLSHENYTLEKVVVLSRHNIRSPLSGGDSVLGKITPHEWFAWTSPASQLSIRGGTLETGMGQYFRKWLEEEGLFPENYQPEEDEVRIYANSKQRTIATARFFTAGLLPAADEPVEYHAEFDTMDPVFNPVFTFLSDSYSQAAEAQIRELYTDDIESLKDNYELLADVIDMKDSAGYKDGTVADFKTDDTGIILEKEKEPSVSGSLKTACSVSDAMTLQFYEETDPVQAAFGNDLSEKQWDEISEIKDVYGDVLFSAPLVSCVVANPLLKELQSEIASDRRFTFLCGHDSNLSSVLSALGVEDYELPETIEKKTPIGAKLVFSNWKGANGEEFWDVDLVYQTTDQLRNACILTEKDHPASVDVSFKNIKANEDGLFTEQELKDLFSNAISEYDRITSEYK